MDRRRPNETTCRQLSQALFANRSATMVRVAQLVQIAIEHPVPVLLCGASGTGKERVARAIHQSCQSGGSRDGPFIALNCGAISETLLEAELFGHRAGAFTGATAGRAGFFEVADGGTLFLDEIGEASSSLQIKLLRALDSHEIVAVGDTQARHVDVRLITATNRDLEGEVDGGRFRADLYYRINTLPIHLPPLVQRGGDIMELATQILGELSTKLRKAIAGFSPPALDCLRSYTWPGNVRELQNEIERAIALTQPGSEIACESLSPKLRVPPGLAGARALSPLRRARAAFEEGYIRRVLSHHRGNAAAAAETLGISRSMLQRKIRTYSLRGKPAT